MLVYFSLSFFMPLSLLDISCYLSMHIAHEHVCLVVMFA